MLIGLDAMMIDGLIGIIVIAFFIWGYYRGFIVRLYDFLATVLSLLGALFISGPMSHMIILYKVDSTVPIMGTFEYYVNRIILFIILFIVFKIGFRIIGLLVKPLLKKSMDKISFFRHADHILGSIISALESLIYIYLALIMVISPLFVNGQEKVSETCLGNFIISMVPSLTNQVKALTQDYFQINDFISQGLSNDSMNGETLASLASSLNDAYDSGILSDEQLNNSLSTYYDYIHLYDGQMSVTQEEYQEIASLVNKLDASQYDHNMILSKLKVE